ncbi:hypothetical protein B296_00033117 [Ensete ventricosum]|uniref:Uncharacterized protein n=1 Tax=Ensete ventricosum TaxID=4639 RepID=A0A426Y2D8_ENSVE|nr:hypothetical protein B296_00033117 [Ensete ventricosum]
MDEENIDYYVWTVDQIFRDFLGRRAGLIEALTAGPLFLSVFLELLAGLVGLRPFSLFLLVFCYPRVFVLDGGVADFKKVPHEMRSG